MDLKEVEVRITVEQSPDEIRAYMRSAISRGLPEFEICNKIKTAVIVAGGPSLKETAYTIKDGYVMACNGAARFLTDRGIVPDCIVVADGDRKMSQIVKDVDKPLPWLMASQCSPEMFDLLKGEDVTLWHLDNGQGWEREILEEMRPGKWLLVGGGSTVGLRAVNIGYLMGARDFHLYGFDSCYSDGDHHAYENPINDDDDESLIFPVFVNGRKFSCSAWMVSQAQEFQRLVKMLPNCTFTVHGDGLIAWIARIMSADMDNVDARFYAKN